MTQSQPAVQTDTILPVGAQLQYERFLPQAVLLDKSELRVFRADPSLVLANARTAVDAVLPHADQIRAELPKVSIDTIRDLPNLGLALAYACARLERMAPAESEIRPLVSRGAELRALLLSTADTLVLAGIFSAAEIRKIREGRGIIDSAADCVALAALFQEHADEVRGKIPFGPAEVAEAADVGSRLLAVLRPEEASRKPAPKEVTEANTIRNQLWTLFERTWEAQVWRAGAWVFGRGVDAAIPALQSRVVPKRAAEPDVAADPSCPPGSEETG